MRQDRKEAELKRESDNLQDASHEGILAAPVMERATAQAHQPSWRIEPEIGQARQEQLARCLTTIPDITHGVYPFKGMKLSRADVDWLLSTPAKGKNPSDGGDERQELCIGLDLRGADLRYTDLHAL